MPQHWNATDVLDVCCDGRCVGYAPSKGRKCRIGVSAFNQGQMDALLSEMSRQRLEISVLRPNLVRLAQHGLCPRFHQGQVEDLVEKWTRKIRARFPTSTINVPDAAHIMTAPLSPRLARSQTSRQSSLEARIRLSGLESDLQHTVSGSRSTTASISRSYISNDSLRPSRRSTSVTASTALSSPGQSEIETLEETIAALEENIRIAQRRLDQLRYTTVSNSRIISPSRVSTSDISEFRLSRSSTVQSVSVQRSERSPSLESQPSHPETSTSTQPCNRHHVRRLSLDEECSICYDDLLLSQSSPSAIVWCRSGCGRSVHRACFEMWRASRVERSEAPTCTACRTEWGPECGC